MSSYIYPTVLFQGLTFTAKKWGHFPTITYTSGATAGQEVVTTDASNNIFVQIEDTVSTTAQVKAAIEATSPSVNGLSAGDLVSIVITTPGTVAVGTSSAMTGAVAPNVLGFYSDQSVTALTSSFQAFFFNFSARYAFIINDDTSGTNKLVFSWDGVNNHGILAAGQSFMIDTVNANVVFLKYINGAPAYRISTKAF